MNDVTDLSRTIVSKSDQLNAEDLMAGPITVTIQDIRANDASDQPISLYIDGGRQPFKPCKTMRRLLIFAWGKDGRAWVGRSMTLFNDPDVKWGGVKVGGIRISHLSHIETDIVLALSETKGKRKPHHIKRLIVQSSANNEQIKTIRGQLQETTKSGVLAYEQAWKSLTADQRKMVGAEEHARLKALAIAYQETIDASGDDVVGA